MASSEENVNQLSYFQRFRNNDWSIPLSIIGIAAPICVTLVRRFAELQRMKINYFPNVLHTQLCSIVPSHNAVGKYSMAYSTLQRDLLKNIIFNYYGQTTLQKHWRRCKNTNPLDPIIRIGPRALKYNHINDMILNSIITNIHQKFAGQWIQRTNPLTMDKNVVNYDNIQCKMYVLALVNTNIYDENVDYINQFKQIRAMVFKEDCLKYFDETYNKEINPNIKDINDMTENEWNDLLDIDYVESIGDDEYVRHCLRGWRTVRHVIKEYRSQPRIIDNQIKWGKPLALLELPGDVDNHSNYGKLTMYNPPVFGGWNSQKQRQITNYKNENIL